MSYKMAMLFLGRHEVKRSGSYLQTASPLQKSSSTTKLARVIIATIRQERVKIDLFVPLCL